MISFNTTVCESFPYKMKARDVTFSVPHEEHRRVEYPPLLFVIGSSFIFNHVTSLSEEM